MSISSSIFRPFRTRDRGGSSYSDFISNFEQSHRYIPSRERHERLSRLYYRSPSLQRLHRIQQLRRRNEGYRQSPRQIVTDGPRFTEDMLLRPRTPTPSSTVERPENARTPEQDADDSVLIVNEVNLFSLLILWSRYLYTFYLENYSVSRYRITLK